MGNSGVTAESFNERYFIGKQLGKGSQGRVHVCVDRVTRKVRAVKVLDRSLKASWATYQREVELCKAAASSCRHVIAVLEEFVDSDKCYVVMEKFEGHLRKALKWVAREVLDNPVSPTALDASGAPVALAGLGNEALRRIAQQTLAGILHLHNTEIVHRDVKAHNLLVDRLDLRDGRCRIVLGDLGLARRLAHGRFLSAQVGTRKYWAPELYEKKYWHAVDVFALGVTVFLSGCCRYPYQDESATRTIDIFATEPSIELLEPGARDFLEQTLEKDPSRRASAAQLQQHPWILEAQALEDSLGPELSPTPRDWEATDVTPKGSRRLGSECSTPGHGSDTERRSPRGDGGSEVYEIFDVQTPRVGNSAGGPLSIFSGQGALAGFSCWSCGVSDTSKEWVTTTASTKDHVPNLESRSPNLESRGETDSIRGDMEVRAQSPDNADA